MYITPSVASSAAISNVSHKHRRRCSDQLNHASIIDAVRVAGVQNKFAYKHSDMEDLEAKLKEVRVHAPPDIGV